MRCLREMWLARGTQCTDDTVAEERRAQAGLSFDCQSTTLILKPCVAPVEALLEQVFVERRPVAVVHRCGLYTEPADQLSLLPRVGQSYALRVRALIHGLVTVCPLQHC